MGPTLSVTVVPVPQLSAIGTDSEETIRTFLPGNQLALAFECASPSEVDETHERVVSARFHGEQEPWDAFRGQRYAQLRDPDGVGVDLYATL